MVNATGVMTAIEDMVLQRLVNNANRSVLLTKGTKISWMEKFCVGFVHFPTKEPLLEQNNQTLPDIQEFLRQKKML
jgi:hypothetical protein